jgi:hypothetical protein
VWKLRKFERKKSEKKIGGKKFERKKLAKIWWKFWENSEKKLWEKF